MRKQFFIVSFILIALMVGGFFILPEIYMPIHKPICIVIGIILLLGFKDAFQTRQTIKRNFPVLGRFRYMLESIRPEIQQYFIETNTDGKPFSREDRSVIYQRSKNVLDTLPFGTQIDVYDNGYEWINHSMMPKHIDADSLRVTIGGADCSKPYSASLFNISAMSFGSLSRNAVLALNGGAKDGKFAHNTGEGGISPHHLAHGGDLIWQIGTGYFGCRNEDGTFNPDLFKEKAVLDSVKMIEVKISQGAKPGHGGILPKEKITPEVAKIRGVGMDKDIVSPPSHTAFSTPIEMLEFIKRLRELSGGKPVGFKFCLGKRRDFMAVCKAMCKTGIIPDFITVDGGEGGTGAAPIEFSNYLGTPGVDALVYVHNCLAGFNLRKDIKIISTGKISTAFGIIKRLALGADLFYSARAMMIAIGCIQALRCNANDCPTGVATQDENLVAGLDVDDKRKRVFNFHKNTMESTAHMLGAMGLDSPDGVHPWHVITRVGVNENMSYHTLFDFVEEGCFIKGEIPQIYKMAYDASTPESF